MKNPIIPEAEVTAVKKVIEAVEELKEIRSCHEPILIMVKMTWIGYISLFTCTLSTTSLKVV